MDKDRSIPVYALNIAATPHPDGVYVRLLRNSAKFLVRAHGSDYARISAPQKTDREGIFTGRILVWTEIDLKGRWYDTTTDDELSAEIRSKIVIPENAKPNFKVFEYVFYEKKHRLYFESINDYNQHLGPTVSERIFCQLLSQELQGLGASNVEVTLVPREGTVKRILAMPGLRKLTMRVVVPNPDATDPAALKRVRKLLTDAKARQLEQTYTKQASAARLVVTPAIKDVAEVAALNGFVTGDGLSGGNKTSLSTSDEPRREMINANAGSTFFTSLLTTIGLF